MTVPSQLCFGSNASLIPRGLSMKEDDCRTQSTTSAGKTTYQSSLAQHERSLNLRVDTSAARLVVGRVGPLVTRRCIY